MPKEFSNVKENSSIWISPNSEFIEPKSSRRKLADSGLLLEDPTLTRIFEDEV